MRDLPSVNDNPSQSISTRIFDLHTRGILEWEIGSPLVEHPLERPSLYLTRLSLAAVINGSRDCLIRLVMQFGCRSYHYCINTMIFLIWNLSIGWQQLLASSAADGRPHNSWNKKSIMYITDTPHSMPQRSKAYSYHVLIEELPSLLMSVHICQQLDVEKETWGPSL